MSVLNNSNPLALGVTGDDSSPALSSSSPVHITITGGGNGFTNGGDQLPTGSAGLPANYGGLSYDQVMAMGTDLQGNQPTISQLAAASGLSGAVGQSSDLSGTTGATSGTGNGILAGSGSSGSTGVDWITDWLQRGALIILGFIFVGVGLNMFGRQGTKIAVINDSPARTAQKAGAKVKQEVDAVAA